MHHLPRRSRPLVRVVGVAAMALALVFANPVASSAALVTGTSGDDRLQGTRGADQIYGLAGADTAFGSRGSDMEYGGAGPDVLHGGVGSDYLYPQEGSDRAYGDKGADYVRSYDGRHDVIRCGPGYDHAWVDRRDSRRGCEFVEIVPVGVARSAVGPQR